jgi:hypothetical protein
MISCSTALNVNPDLANAVSSGGTILGSQTITLPKGSSVYDALVATGIGFGGSSSYITSINSIGEGDCGPGSGWMYNVNGGYPTEGSGSYTLNNGDAVAWLYTCNRGADLGASV